MRYARIAALLWLGLLLGAPLPADELADRSAASRAVLQEFASRLQGELQAAMQAGGPLQAIAVCRRRAPAIAMQLSSEQGWWVARTALRVRNRGNAPDPWERAVLEDFVRRQQAGAAPAELERAEWVREDCGRLFRYMKAIPTGDLCLVCHGPTLAPELAAELARRYPQDQATGFRLGELRGAFSIIQPAD